MIAQATPAARPVGAPGTAALVGNKVPLPHRFHMTDGRTLVGDLHKAPTARLADHLSTLKGFISVTGACCERTGTHFPYIVVNQDHVLFIEELGAPAAPVKVATREGCAMFHGRVLVVSDRREVVDELDPVVRAEGHLTLTVPNGEEALRVFEEGIIPDVVVTDLGSGGSLEGIGYLRRFRELNQLGQHLVVVEPGAPFSGTATGSSAAGFRVEPFTVLPRPLDRERVRGCIAGAMERIRADLQSLRGEMFRETARLQRAIREAQLEMVTALAMTMEAKDPYMHGHCSRVAELSRLVAVEMGVEDADIELLHAAALLHEIGKMGVSLELLHKTAPLTPEELEQIRAHTRVGAQIVGAVPSLRRIAPLIANQYTSYAELPDHISPELPEFLLAGILRVVDTYDAMTSDRSYRETLPRELWESVLRGGAGSKFHPEAVVALLRVERRVRK